MSRRSAPPPAAHLLEVVPPREATAGPGAVENLLATLTLAAGCALEIACAEGGRPRFLARAPSEADRAHLARQLVGQYPQGTVAFLDASAADPAAIRDGEAASACELRLGQPPHLPLRTYRDLDARDGNDPLVGVLSALADLPPDLRGLCQLALWPADPHWGRDVGRLVAPQSAQARASRLEATGAGESALPTLIAGGLALVGWKGVTLYQAGDALHLVLLGTAGLLALPAGLWVAEKARPTAPPDPALVREKVAHRGFVARLRLLVVGGGATPGGLQVRAAALARLVAAYGPYDLPSGNALVARSCAPCDFVRPRPTHSLLPGRRPLPLLNSREAASLWHLPTAAASVPGLRRGGSRAILAAHTVPGSGDSHPSGAAGGIAIGLSRAQGKAAPVALPTGFLRRNTLILGSAGSGKTTLLQHLIGGILADPAWGLLVLDPHSSLAPRVLELLPPARAAAAVAVRLADTERPIGLNLLDTHGGRGLAQIEDGLIAALKYHWEGSWGARMENVFRYALRTLLHANRGRPAAAQYTLLEVNPLLTNGPFRMDVLRQVQDADLHRYWLEVYAPLSRHFRDEMIMPVQNKVDRFNQEVLRNVVGQRATTLSLTPLLEHNAPLIVDTAAAQIGRDNAGLLGATLLDLLATRMRERGEGAQRLVIVVDEFQQTPADWATMLETLRKYGGSCVLATQSLAALERTQPGLRGAVFGNHGTLAVFQVSAEDARYLAPELNEDVEVADLINLPVRHAYVRATDGEQRLPVFSVEVPLPPAGDPQVARTVARRTAAQWGQDRSAVEAERQAFLARLYPAPSGREGGDAEARNRGRRQRGGRGATAGAAADPRLLSGTTGSGPAVGPGRVAP